MRPILGSLTFRIGLAFLLGLILLQVVIAAAVVWPDGQPAMFRLISPHEAGAIARALEATPKDQRDLLLDALNAGPLVVHLQSPSSADADQSEHRAAPYLTELYARYAAELDGRPFQVEARGDQTMLAHDHGSGRAPAAVRLVIHLRSGEILVIERAPAVLRRLLARFAVIGGTAAAVLLLVLLYCIHQVVLPARRLARAARDLALNIDMPDLPAQGATEISMMAIAFNDMKQTIRGLVHERTRMLAAIAHDCRTYLTRLRLRAEFIDDSHQRAQAVHDLDDMNTLLDDTMIFAREATATDRPAERCDVGAELQSLVRIRQEMGEPVTLDISHPDTLTARCSPLALRRMLANLTDNALRYGKVAELAAVREDAIVKLSIADRGPGVPADALQRILQPFERLESSRGRQTGGAGLGLAIVSALARSQGGDFDLENRTEGGLRATISLPAAD